MFPDVSRCFCLVYDEHSTILYEYTVVNSIVLSESTIHVNHIVTFVLLSYHDYCRRKFRSQTSDNMDR